MQLSELCMAIGGELDGADCEVTSVSSLMEARAGDVSFLANLTYTPQVAQTNASAVLVAKDFVADVSCALVRVDNVDAAFTQVVAILGPKPASYEPGIDPTALISPDAQLGEGVTVGPYCVVEAGARIGAGTVLVAQVYVGRDVTVGTACLFHAGVKIREACELGNRVILQCGAVIGSDGFGYASVDGTWQKIPQVGIVVLGDDVEVGANATIDRARFGRTYIAKGVKIDNLVQIAHNVQVGEHTAMAAQTGIAGSTRIGSHVQLGGQSGVSGHLVVPDHTAIGAKTGVVNKVDAPDFLLGMPAVNGKDFMRRQAALAKLPGLIKQVRALERKIEELEQSGS
jgi:UDP-3-O-[3-hydroxymyristoyl] glucosamine N-acyltransferase